VAFSLLLLATVIGLWIYFRWCKRKSRDPGREDLRARLADGPTQVLDVAFDCGFEDVSNFNYAFSAELGCAPRAYAVNRFRTAARGEKSL